MDNLKIYVKHNSQTLFRFNNLKTNAVFDNRGFFFSDVAQLEYNQIKGLPHLYVAWTDSEDGFIYVGISNQKGGRWKRYHAYHLGTLAHHLLDTTNNYDQNHQHWIDYWIDIDTLDLGNNTHQIQLFREVKICFIPFKLYSSENHLLLSNKQIKVINEKTEKDLIKSYLLDGFKLLNKHNNRKAKNVKINKTKTMKSNSNIKSEEKCILFKVNINESIHDVVNNYPNLPIPCRFICRNSLNPNQFVYPSVINYGWRKTGNGLQNIYTYFNNVDINYANNHGYNANIRWRFIQEEMQIMGINEITVTVCPI